MKIIEEANRAKKEELAFYRWAVSYQTEISFDEFKKNIGMLNITGKQEEKNEKAEEILKEVEEILNGDI